MGISKDISLNVLASVTGYAKELGKIPGITEKEAAKAAKALGAQLAKAEVQALKNVRPAVQSAEKSFKELGRAAGAVSPQLGALARDADDLIQAFGPIGIAAGLTAAVGALFLGLGKLTLAAAENADELQRAGLISRESAAAVKDAAETVNAASAAWKAMGVELAAFFASGLQGWIRSIFALSMAWDDLIHGRGLKSVDTYVAQVLEVEAAVRQAGETFKSALPMFDREAAGLMAVAAAEAAVMVAQKEGVAAIVARMHAARDIHAQQHAMAEERIELMRQEGASALDLRIALDELYAADMQAQAEDLAFTKQIEAQKRAERQKSVDQAVQFVDILLGAGRTAAAGQVEVQAAMQAVQIALAAAAAGWRFVSDGGPLAWPLAVATWIAGGVSAGWAAGQTLGSKSKHPIPSIPGVGDRGDARRARRDERRSNRARNRDDDGDIVVVNQWRHRIYDDATADALRRNSVLSKALQSNPHRSH